MKIKPSKLSMQISKLLYCAWQNSLKFGFNPVATKFFIYQTRTSKPQKNRGFLFVGKCCRNTKMPPQIRKPFKKYANKDGGEEGVRKR